MLSWLVRFLTLCLLWVLGLLAVFSTATYILLAIPSVRSNLFSLAVQGMESTTGWTATAGDIQTVTPFQWRLRNISLTMPGQIPITAGEMEVKLSPVHLLRGKIYFSNVTVSDFILPPSVSFSMKKPMASVEPLHAFPLALLSLHIGHLEIYHASIPRAYLGHTGLLQDSDEMNLHIHVLGELQASLAKVSAVMNLSIHREEAPDHRTLIGVRVFRKADSMIVKITSSEEDGLVSHLSGLPAEFKAKTKLSLPVWEETDSCSTAASCTGSFHVSIGAPLVEHFFKQWSLFGGEPVAAEGQYTFYPDGAFTVSNLKLRGKNPDQVLALEGMLEVDPKMTIHQGEFTASLSDLSVLQGVLDLPISGAADIVFTATGHFGTPKVSLLIAGHEIQFFDHHIGEMTLKSLSHIRSNIVVSTVSVDLRQTQFTCNASWDYGPTMSLERIRLQLPTTLLEGTLSVKLDDFTIVGALRGHVEDLSQLPFMNQWELEGKADLLAEWRPENAKTIHLSFLMHNARLEPFRSAELSLDLELSNYLTTPRGKIKLHSKELLIGNAMFKEIVFETAIAPGLLRWPFQVSTNGRWEEQFKLEATGEFNPFPGSLSVVMSSAEGMLCAHPLRLQSPIEITPHEKGVDISPVSLQIGDGHMDMQVHVDAGEVCATLGFQLVPVELLYPLCPSVPISGTMTGSAGLEGTLESPEGQFQLSFKQLKTNNPSLAYLQPVNAEFTGYFKDNVLIARGTCSGIGDHPIDVKARLPLRLSLSPYNIDFDKQAPLSIRMNANGEFSPIFQLLFPRTASVTGMAKMAVEITGSLDTPRIEGQLDLRDCAYESFELGCVMGAIRAHFEGDGSYLVLKSFEATDGQNGRVTGQGSIHLDPAAKFPYEATFTLDNTITLRRDFIEATTSGQLRLSSDGEKSLLQGKLTVDRALVSIPKQLPQRANNMEVTVVNSPKKTLPPIISEGPPCALDVQIDCPKNWLIRAEELRSEWRGQAHVTGDSKHPLFHGELRATRGDFRVNGRSFFLDRGIISFAGDLSKKTTLNVSASQDIDRIQVQALLKGPLQHPSLTFSSNPPMSQREILSWVVFNHGLDSDSDAELTGQAIVDLTSSSGGSSSGLLNSLKRVGIDRIDFDSRESQGDNDLSVNIGKYISRDLYINYNKGITSESNKVSVEAHVIRNVKFKAEVDDEAAGKMLLMWKHHY